MGKDNHLVHKVSAGALLVTLGIIFGDIGTSTLYVMKAIVGKNPISADLVMGAISCVIWTLTLITTFKYVILTLRANNKGEGGIFSLFTLVRRTKVKWLLIPAVIGGSALLADGIITPSISVSSAVEGLRAINPDIHTVPIVILILTLLFTMQQFGTNFIGNFFGPIMLVWFLTLAVLGFSELSNNWSILRAINPKYAYDLLVLHPGGFWVLSAVFLCTTGAEALYSDLGHCGKDNIRIAWIFVKLSLLLNYLGQGAWLLSHEGKLLSDFAGGNPFYSIMPEWFLVTGIIIATAAAVVASQALISAAFTLINEAIRLNFWPKVKLVYPTLLKGQIYIPSINWLLWLGCVFAVLHFRESSNMESAYGLTIIIDMLMTSTLLLFFMYLKRYNVFFIISFAVIYYTIEFSFLVANLAKFLHGGWISIRLVESEIAMWNL